MSLFGRGALGRQSAGSIPQPLFATHWWDFSSPSNYTTSGSNLSTADDLIGSADFSVAGGTVTTSSYIPVSGFKTIGSVGGYVQAATGTLVQPYTIIVVAASAGISSGPSLFSSGGFVGTQGIIFHRNAGGTGYSMHSGAFLDFVAFGSTTPQVLWVEFNGASSRVFKDSGVTAIASGNTGTNTTPTPIRFLSNQDGSQDWDGTMGEVYVCESGIESDATRIAVMSYLKTKWAIP